ncbi:hypothetical protein IW248_002584 [Micromonospora ureilytica]|uniref:Uncharacterized protein n=1 Tax=Micromonospora ureilytica TaxID=709868 RepID=A0ABS0JGX1_9ACTN|nr:hypothetical protein [Micromonospora ureilytica]
MSKQTGAATSYLTGGVEMQFFPTSHHNPQKRTGSQKRGMMSMKPNKSPVIYCVRAIANEPQALPGSGGTPSPSGQSWEGRA